MGMKNPRRQGAIQTHLPTGSTQTGTRRPMTSWTGKKHGQPDDTQTEKSTVSLTSQTEKPQPSDVTQTEKSAVSLTL